MQNKIVAPTENSAEEWARYVKGLWNDDDNSKRKAESKVVIDYYRSKQMSYLETELKKIFTDMRSYNRKRKWTQNYTKQIIDSLAQCYNSRVRREINGELDGEQQEDIKRLLFMGLNNAMSNVNKWLILERTALVFARWSEKKSRMVYKSYHQFQFDLIYDPDSDDKELLAVILSDYRSLEDSNIFIYTKDKTFTFRGEHLVKQVDHNLGVLPFVVLYAEDPGFEDYLDPMIELSQANLELNIAQSNLLNVLQSQAHGTMVLTSLAEQDFSGIDDGDPNNPSSSGLEGDRRIDLHDPDKLVELTMSPDGDKPELSTLQHEADFTGALDTIRFLANSLANSMGLDHGVFEVQVSTNPATVFHINEKRRQAIIGDYQSIFVDAERELFEKSLAITRRANVVLPVLAVEDYVIEFSPERAMVDKMGSTDVVNLRDAGVIDTIETVKHHYGSLNRDEAMKFIIQMAEDEVKVQELLAAAGLKPATEPVEEELEEQDKPAPETDK